MVDKEQLTRLHETYVWYVNAAVGEGRLDLVEQLADEYLDEALTLMTSGESPACDKPGCAACRPRPVEPPVVPSMVRRATRWRRWLGLGPPR